MYVIPSLSSGFTFFFGLRRAAALGMVFTPDCLEGRFIVEAASAAAGRGRSSRPGVVAGVAATAATLLAATGRTEPATAGAARHLLHLRRGVPQRRADLVDFQLVHSALLALLRLVRPLAQPARDDHARTPLQRLGDVLRRLPPHRTGQEQRLAVLPLTRRAVQGPGRRGDPELGDRGTRRGEAQFGIIGQVADDRDGGLSCHRLLLVSIHVARLAYPYDRSGGARYVSGRPAGSPWYAAPTR